MLVSALSCDFQEQPENSPGPVWKSGRKDLHFEGGSLLSLGVTAMDPGAGPPAGLLFMTRAGVLGLEVTWIRASLLVP